MSLEEKRALVEEIASSVLDRVALAADGNGNGDRPSQLSVDGKEIGAVGTTVFGGIIHDPFESNVDFQDSARWQTIRTMLYSDAKVWASHQARILPLRQAKWAINPSPETSETAAFVHDCLFSRRLGMRREGPRGSVKIRPFRSVIHDVSNYIRWGFALFEKVYRVDEEGRTRWADFALRLPWTIVEWEADSKGNLVRVRQEWSDPKTGNQESAWIPAEKILIFTHEQVGSDWRGVPLARFQRKHYRLKEGLEKIDAIAVERNAMGVPKWQLPRNPGKGDESRAEAIVENVRTHEKGGVVVPFGHDFKVEGVSGTVREAVPSIRYHGEEISLTTLAQMLDLGKTSSGARALADPILDLFQLVLLGDALQVCEIISTQAIVELVDLNFGPQDEYPELSCSLLSNRNLSGWLDGIAKAKEAGVFGAWSRGDIAHARKETSLPDEDPAAVAEEERKEKEEAAREADRMDALRRGAPAEDGEQDEDGGGSGDGVETGPSSSSSRSRRPKAQLSIGF